MPGAVLLAAVLAIPNLEVRPDRTTDEDGVQVTGMRCGHAPHLQLAPAGVAQPITSNWTGAPSYTWGLAAGYRCNRRGLQLLITADFIHEVMTVRHPAGSHQIFDERRGHAFALIPTARIGGTRGATFGYLVFGFGLAAHRSRLRGPEYTALERDAGIMGRVGGGVQWTSKRGIGLGPELALEAIGYGDRNDFGPAYSANANDYLGGLHVRLLMNVSFGWGLEDR